MAIGKQVGSFKAEATSITVSKTSGGGSQFDLNVEGTVSGAWDAALLSTMTLTTSDFESGSYTATVAAYLANGDVLTGEGSGVFKSLGGHKWQLNGTTKLSDGSCMADEAEMALATRSLEGKIFEIT